jgi:hypothetical protein
LAQKDKEEIQCFSCWTKQYYTIPMNGNDEIKTIRASLLL